VQLAVDIGNSRIKTALFSNDELISNQISDLHDVNLIKSQFDENAGINAIIISSVQKSPHLYFNQIPKNIYTVLLDHETLLPIISQYESPETLGHDRLALAVGATVLCPSSNCLVVDAGTCLTMDIIDEKGHFLGGTISPGVQLRLNSMHKGTANLPEIKFDYTLPEQIGRDTVSCMKSGAVNGLINEFRSTIKVLESQFDNLQIIFTGGDAKIFDKELKSGIFADPNLLLRGLNKILLYNIEEP